MQNIKNRFLSAGFVFLCVFISTFFSMNAQAQIYRSTYDASFNRTFPDDAYRGSFRILNYPYVEMDGKREILTPGARIFDQENRIIPHAFLGDKRYVVNYVRFDNGELHSVWILTNNEMRERRRVANPKWWDKLFETMDNVVDLAKWLGIAAL